MVCRGRRSHCRGICFVVVTMCRTDRTPRPRRKSGGSRLAASDEEVPDEEEEEIRRPELKKGHTFDLTMSNDRAMREKTRATLASAPVGSVHCLSQQDVQHLFNFGVSYHVCA